MITGIIFTILGLIGLAVPVLPQVPFFIIAIVSFCNVSKKFRGWIRGKKLYQKYLAKYADRYLALGDGVEGSFFPTREILRDL
ncbi:MAG: YbaN family protein [Lachnospiraceae bacterium]|nr:YbaN family protein [Lachnospiraceae bacterium]